MPYSKGPRVFLDFTGRVWAAALRPDPLLKKGLVPYLSGGGTENKYSKVKRAYLKTTVHSGALLEVCKSSFKWKIGVDRYMSNKVEI